jgi:hypothetical protein
MRTSTLVIKDTQGTWTLRFAVNVGTDQEVVKRWTVKTLIQALDLARTLQIHIDNASRLPVSQYRMAA